DAHRARPFRDGLGSIRVPPPGPAPERVPASSAGVVITASSPPLARNSSAASIFGPMLPDGNWPSARWRAASSAVIVARPAGRRRREAGHARAAGGDRRRGWGAGRGGGRRAGAAFADARLGEHVARAGVLAGRAAGPGGDGPGGHGNAPAARRDDQEAGLDQGPDRVDLDDASGLRGGDDAAVTAAGGGPHGPPPLGPPAR